MNRFTEKFESIAAWDKKNDLFHRFGQNQNFP